MKKLFILFVALVLSFGLIACGNETTDVTTEGNTTVGETTVEDTTTTVAALNEFPTLSGVQSAVTVAVGDTYDPFAGVTANDAEDGDITDDITIDNLDCLHLDASNVVGAEAGGATCVLVYKVEDSEGAKAQQNSTVTVEVVVDPTLNGLVNGDFSLGSNGWANTDGSLVDLYNGAVGSGEVVNEELVITVAGPSWDGSAPRVNQEGIAFENGKTYEVSIDAKANVDGLTFKSQVGVLLSADPWFTPYYYNEAGAYEFALTTSYQTFTYKFTVTEATTDNGTLTLEFGANEVGDADYVFYLDNLVVKESTPDPDVDAPVFSGLADVNVGLSEAFDPLDGVSFYDVDTTLTNDDIVISHDGGATVTLEADGTYTFSELGDVVFTYVLEDADGNVATETRTVSVVAMVYEQPYALFGAITGEGTEDSVLLTYTDTPANWWESNAQLEIVRFDGTQDSITFTFTGVDTHMYLFKVEFADGAAVEAGITADGTEQSITLDLSGLTEAQRDTMNLFILFCQTPTGSGTIDINRLDYAQKDYPEAWTANGLTTEADYEKEVIIYGEIGDPWWNVYATLPVSGYDGTKTSITFTFKGVQDQSYMVKVESDGNTKFLETPFVATGEIQEIVVDLSSWTETERNAIDLFGLFINEVGAPAGEITYYGWDYTPEFIPTWNVYGNWSIEANENSEVISYGVVGGNWWESNAQLEITGFDGTEDSITFTFSSVLDQTYMIKVENADGGFIETVFTGTGASQDVVVDLSGWTQAQRDGIDLFILFVNEAAAPAGEITVYGWDYTV